MSASIIVSFFNVNDYELPKKYLQETLRHALNSGSEVVFSQAVLPGQDPLPYPPGVISLVYEVPSYFFYKENLWNLAAKKASGDILIFIDADVTYTNPDWVKNAEEALKTCDIVQPFTKAVWLDEFGNLEKERIPCSHQLIDDEKIGLSISHPGFGWAMTREAFDRIGGWYDQAANGAGDVAFVFSLASESQFDLVMKFFPEQDRMVLTPSFQKYREHVDSLGLTVGRVPECVVTHKWHGTMRNRNYCRRDKCMPRIDDYEYNLVRREDGVLVWGDEKSAEAFKELFSTRLDDGTPPKVILISKDHVANNEIALRLRAVQFEIKTTDGNCVGIYITPLTDLIESNKKQGLPVLTGLVSADCLSGSPASEYWRDIAEDYPDIKFVLYYKDPHQAIVDRFKEETEEVLPYKTLLRAYEDHNCEVLDYFKDKRNNFLLLTSEDYADNFKRLTDFLGVETFRDLDYSQLIHRVEKTYFNAKPVVITGTPGAWVNLVSQKLFAGSWKILWPGQTEDPETVMFLQRNSQNIKCQELIQGICKKGGFELFSTEIPEDYYKAKDEVLSYLGKFENSPPVIGGVGNWAFLDIWSPYVEDVIAIEATEEEDLDMLNLLTEKKYARSTLQEIREFHLSRYDEGLKGFKHVCRLANSDVKDKQFDKLTTFLNSRF